MLLSSLFLSTRWVFLFPNFCRNYMANTPTFSTEHLKSDMGILEIVKELDTLLPELAKFICNFNTTVGQSGINVMTDAIGTMSIDVPQNMSEEVANKLSTRIGIIDRLIATKSQNISDLLQKGAALENKLRSTDFQYVSQLTDRMEEYKKLISSYKH